MRAGVGNVPDVQILHMVADLHAAHTLDAFRRIAHQWGAAAPAVFGNLLFKMFLRDAEVVAERLQGTVAASGAGGTVVIVLGQDQLYVDAARLAHLRAVGIHRHSLADRGVAGRL